jgi:hypothetical protein
MRNSDRSNISAISLFDQSLNQYEETMDTIKANPNLFSGPAQYLQQALNRMLTASVPDAHEMMRSLAKRMISGNPCYSEHSLLLIASGSVNNIFKDEIMAIPYTLLSTIRGNDPSLDHNWLNRVNGNKGIEIFFKNYKTSDITILHTTNVNNLVTTTLPYETVYSSDASVVVRLGEHPIDLTLSSNEVQTISFDKQDSWIPHALRRQNKPVVYTSYLIIRPQVKAFRIPKTIKITPSTKELIDAFGCVTIESSIANYYQFKIPAPLFTHRLELTSFDSGQSWTITNLRIAPPGLV